MTHTEEAALLMHRVERTSILHSNAEAMARLVKWRRTLPVEVWLRLWNAEPYRNYEEGETC